MSGCEHLKKCCFRCTQVLNIFDFETPGSEENCSGHQIPPPSPPPHCHFHRQTDTHTHTHSLTHTHTQSHTNQSTANLVGSQYAQVSSFLFVMMTDRWSRYYFLCSWNHFIFTRGSAAGVSQQIQACFTAHRSGACVSHQIQTCLTAHISAAGVSWHMLHCSQQWGRCHSPDSDMIHSSHECGMHQLA